MLHHERTRILSPQFEGVRKCATRNKTNGHWIYQCAHCDSWIYIMYQHLLHHVRKYHIQLIHHYPTTLAAFERAYYKELESERQELDSAARPAPEVIVIDDEDSVETQYTKQAQTGVAATSPAPSSVSVASHSMTVDDTSSEAEAGTASVWSSTSSPINPNSLSSRNRDTLVSSYLAGCHSGSFPSASTTRYRSVASECVDAKPKIKISTSAKDNLCLSPPSSAEVNNKDRSSASRQKAMSSRSPSDRNLPSRANSSGELAVPSKRKERNSGRMAPSPSAVVPVVQSPEYESRPESPRVIVRIPRNLLPSGSPEKVSTPLLPTSRLDLNNEATTDCAKRNEVLDQTVGSQISATDISIAIDPVKKLENAAKIKKGRERARLEAQLKFQVKNLEADRKEKKERSEREQRMQRRERRRQSARAARLTISKGCAEDPRSISLFAKLPEPEESHVRISDPTSLISSTDELQIQENGKDTFGEMMMTDEMVDIDLIEPSIDCSMFEQAPSSRAPILTADEERLIHDAIVNNDEQFIDPHFFEHVDIGEDVDEILLLDEEVLRKQQNSMQEFFGHSHSFNSLAGSTHRPSFGCPNCACPHCSLWSSLREKPALAVDVTTDFELVAIESPSTSTIVQSGSFGMN